MKKLLRTLTLVVTFFLFCAVSASAVVNDTVKVGLKYGSGALFSANLENAEGDGYDFGYYDEDRDFISLGSTEERAISMTAAGTVYMDSSGGYSTSMPSGSYRVIGAWHVQLDGFDSFEEAQETADDEGGYPAWISGEYVVRIGSYDSKREAEDDRISGSEVVQSTSTGVLVTETKTTDVLFEFDCQGILALGIAPEGWGDDALTWFKGYRYRGGFEYARVTGGNLNVINVVDLEDYVKGVIPHEMSGDWPLAALEAQAVCARTYASRTTKHLSAYDFDVCNTTDCQIYYGANNSTDTSDEAVDNTAGICLYYDGELAEAVYYSSNGGASSDAQQVWGGNVEYLQGKEDPYEDMISIPNYSYTTSYTSSQLTWILQNKGYSIGTIQNAYVSEYTDYGNVYRVTFEDSNGETLTVKGETCRTIFYSSTYGKSVRSMRFDINGGSGGTSSGYYVNSTSNSLSDLSGVSVISGDGTVGRLEDGTVHAITSSGTAALSEKSSGGNTASSGDGFTITGTGNGHNVGMSQYGAKAMAEQDYDYEDILEFYYTDVTVG